VIALFLIVNHIIDEAPFQDWWVAIGLLVVSGALWAWMWQESLDGEDSALMVVDEPVDTVPGVQEWVISKEDTSETDTVDVDVDIEDVPEESVQLFDDDAELAGVVDVEEEPEVEAPPAKEAAPAAKAETPAAPKPTAGSDEPDDLQRVEGIGPKYADALIAAGISTFEAVAASSVEELEAAAKAYGMRRSASMATWAEQAALAAKADWDGLDALQEELSGGRRD